MGSRRKGNHPVDGTHFYSAPTAGSACRVLKRSGRDASTDASAEPGEETGQQDIIFHPDFSIRYSIKAVPYRKGGIFLPLDIFDSR